MYGSTGMRLIDIHTDGFGKLNGVTYSFSDGFNVIYGENEHGKTTLHSLIRAMFFGMPRETGVRALTDTWSHYKPWYSDSYNGVLRIEKNGHIFRIERDFSADPTGAAVTDETEGVKAESPEAFLNEVLCGLSAEAYDNSISVGQLSSTADRDAAEELKKYIVNVGTTGDPALNAGRARAYLRSRRTDLEAGIVPDAARQYAASLTEIKKLEADLARPEYESRIDELAGEIKSIEAAVTEGHRKKEALKSDLEEKQKTFDGEAFAGKDSIEEFRKKAEALYSACRTEEEKGLSRRYSKWSDVTVLIGELTAMAGIMGTRMPRAEIVLRVSGWFHADPVRLGMVFLVIALFGFTSTLFLRKKSRDADGHLQGMKDEYLELAGSHIEDSELSDESHARLLAKLDTLSAEADSIMELKHSAEGLDEESRRLELEELRIYNDLKDQVRIREEVDDKIARLNSLKEDSRMLALAAASNERIREDIEAVDIAEETIERLASENRSTFARFLNKDASDYIREITDGVYDSMYIDEDLNVFMNTRDRMVPVEQLSSGTSDQVYLAVRLASSGFLGKGGDSLPLVLDDSFVNYDHRRLEATLAWMGRAVGGQIILFTCHRREHEMLLESGTEHNYIELTES